MRELLLKRTISDDKTSLAIVEPADGNIVYAIEKQRDSLLGESFTVQSKSEDSIAEIKMEHVLFTPGKLPVLTLSTKEGKRFTVKKEIIQLSTTITVEGEDLTVSGNIYSEFFKLLCKGRCIATFCYDKGGKSVCLDENYELLVVLFTFAIELAK